jgi:hypothetical protein
VRASDRGLLTLANLDIVQGGLSVCGVNTRQFATNGWIPRLLLYGVAGGLVGFLFLGELGLSTVLPVMILLALLAVGCLIAALRGNPSLSPWAIFLFAAMIVPLMIDSRLVGLPRCSDVAAGVACFAGTRDYQTPFVLEVVVLTIAAAAIAMQARRIASTKQRA